MRGLYLNVFKRLIDILISLLIIPIVIIPSLLVGIIIFLEDRGKVFYKGKRLGKNGNIFCMYKFRTMKEKNEDIRNEDGSTYNGDDDPRVTRIGRILRKTSIDELPQIINVLKGDMSFIGPRPDLPEHIDMYTKEEKRKLLVRPGITGYNQAYYRNSVSWKKRIKNDIYYIDNLSFWIDVKVFFKTIYMVLKKDGIYIEKESKEKEKDYAK